MYTSWLRRSLLNPPFFNERYVNGSKLEYEEVMRDSCTGANYMGVEALCCVRNSTQILLVSTQGAEPHEFPHMARFASGNHVCGATIVSKRFILTAGHCIWDNALGEVRDASSMVLRLGTNDANDKEHTYSVKRVIPHENFTGIPHQPIPGKPENDLALLELEQDIQFGDNIKALELAPKGFIPIQHADQVVFAGWGITRTGEISQSLEKGNAMIWKDEQCYGPGGRWNANGFEDRKMCVGGVYKGKWSASTPTQGDSGGPLICRGEDGRAVLCGVVSEGGDDQACWEYLDEAHCKPVQMTEVAFYYDWIISHSEQQDPDTLYKPYLYGKNVNKKSHYEHQVHVTSASGKSCGGTLIAQDVVLTAAQCIASSDGTRHSNLKVTFGITDLNSENGQTFGANKVAILPDFQEIILTKLDRLRDRAPVTAQSNYFSNDLALVKLDRTTSISQDKLPRLPEVTNNSYTAGTEVSFFARNTSNPYAGELMSREFRLLDQEDCQRRMDRLSSVDLDVRVDKNIVCGVEKYSGGSICDRELGGGLICTGENGEDILCGVQSFRLCQFSIPNAFVDVGFHANWVKQEMDNF